MDDNFTFTDIESLKDDKPTIDLRKRVPIASRFILKRLFPWIALFIAAVFSTTALKSILIEGNIDDTILYSAVKILSRWGLYALGFAVIVRTIYEFYYQKRIEYYVNDGHLIVTKGVFLQERGTFALITISDVTVSRSILDLLFGLYNVIITSPSVEGQSLPGAKHGILIIRGLSPKNALELQETINKMLYELKSELSESRILKAVNN